MSLSQSTTRSNTPQNLLTNSNFLLLWSAYAISAMGDHLSEMAILKTQNALESSVDITPIAARATFLLFLPFFFLGPFSGWLADRLPRRGIMIFADGVRCVVMFFFAGLILWSEPLGAWGPFAPLALVGVFAALFSPARSALLPTLIRPDQLIKANAMISGLGIIATTAATAIGGYLATHYAPTVAFRIDAATFLVSAMCLMFIRPRKDMNQRVSRRGMVDELIRGFSYVRAHRRVIELIGIAVLVWFCGPLVYSVIPAVTRDVYHGDYQAISNMRAVLGGGLLIGSVMIASLGGALRSEVGITWGLFGIAASIALLALSTFLPFDPGTLSRIGASAIFTAGFFAVPVMAGFSSLLQRIVADRFRGRVFGVNDLCTMAALLTATGALGLQQKTRIDHYAGHILAAVALITACAAAATMILRYRQSPFRSKLTLVTNLNEFLAKSWWRLKRVGYSTVPRTGPVIVASNHTSSPDPLFLCAAAVYRPMGFLVATEFAGWPIVRGAVKLVGCIPVTRSGQDLAAFKAAVRHLQAGNALGVFIEGRIAKPGEIIDPKDGAAKLALMTGAPVIPAFISGTKYRASVFRGLLARHNARVRFGKPVDLSDLAADKKDRDTVRLATQRIHAAIQALGRDVSIADKP
ncbi:MAG: MFS transporter [Planctomycetota bacterium]